MVLLNNKQEELIAEAVEALNTVTPVLVKLEEDYLYAVYVAKKKLRDVVDEVRDSGVPQRRISAALGFDYPQKMLKFLEPPSEITSRIEDEDITLLNKDNMHEGIEDLESVVRDYSTGVVTAIYMGKTYKVQALGPDDEMWATSEPGIPQGVYELIEQKFPAFVTLDEEEDN